MKLLAISDLHVGFPANAAALDGMPARPDDWLILAGDIGETVGHLESTLAALAPRYRQLVWCPGNHELWAVGQEGLRGVAKYDALVEVCRRYSVLTPEDDYAIFDPGAGAERFLIAPLFLLYDYTFRPDDIAPERAVAWAAESGIMCADEARLDPTPFASRSAWCHARCAWSEERLARATAETGLRTILINHFPLKQSLARLPAVPRFQVWCGTRLTEDWHQRFRAAVVVSGHLHIRQRCELDGTRFEEVSLGYPERQWNPARGIAPYVREVWPASAVAPLPSRPSALDGSA
ncbi:MAG: metallophosphoesterase [Polyangiales bacterium]